MDKLESDTYRVQFLLTTGFIQLVKEVPSRLPFLIPNKGWAVCTPTKIHKRVSRLEVLDKVIFRVDTESMPSVQARGSLKQRLNSAMFNQSDFNTNNVIFPEILHLARDSTDHVQTRERKEMKDKLMSHIVSSTVDNTPVKEETVMTSKMKRSIPGDFRSSVEAGRTGKHGLTDPNDSTASDCHTDTLASGAMVNNTPSYSGGGGECDVTSTRNTPGPPTSSQNTPQSWYYPTRYTPSSGENNVIEQYLSTDQYPSTEQYSSTGQFHAAYLLHNGGAVAVDRTLTPTDYLNTNNPYYVNNQDPELTPVNCNSRDLTKHQDQLTPTPGILQTPVRRRIIVARNPGTTTVKVAKTVSIPVCDSVSSSDHNNIIIKTGIMKSDSEKEVSSESGGDDAKEENEGSSVSHSCESINVTDD